MKKWLGRIVDHLGLVTVELCSKGPGRKGNPPIREMLLGPISYFPIYFHHGPVKSLRTKYNCILFIASLAFSIRVRNMLCMTQKF